MKILVATKQTQGQRKNDFSWTDDGEILCFGFECDHSVDGPCGCRRSLNGLNTRKATTTMMVADLPLTKEALQALIFKSEAQAGWRPTEVDTAKHAEALIDLAESFPVGAVLERRGEVFKRRKA